MSDARTRGEVRNRTTNDFWCLISDREGDALWAFKLLAGQRTDPMKNDVDFCKPVDPNLRMQGRANQWWKVRGGPTLMTAAGSDVLITELSAPTALLSRIKDPQDFRSDAAIESQWRAKIRYLGGQQVSNANSLPFDQSFATPPAAVPAPITTTPAAGSAGRAYTVQAGDWLSKIAMRPDVLKDALLWPLIHEHAQNFSVIGPDPNKLKPGMVILLPSLASFTPKQISDARQRGRNWRR